ncbi:MAG: hypothetical protein ACXWRE_04345 [Pseudobdellovibrionaceae bacterium]
MKRIIVLVAGIVFLSAGNFAEARENKPEEGLDQVPSMSGKTEVMEELGLIEHLNPSQQALPKKSATAKKTAPQKARVNHLANIAEGQ